MEQLQPAFEENDILVVFASDANYAMYLGVAIQSLIDNSSSTNNYDIWVLDSGISNDNKNLIQSLIGERKNFSIRFFDMSKLVEEYNDRFFTSRHITTAAYNRLFIPDIFFRYKRAVYLDCDLIVRTDIAELHNIELNGKSIGASLDYIAKDGEKHGREILGDRWKEYFNSGVLVFNIEKLRKENFFNKCITYLKDNPELECHDQDTLNAVCVGDTQLIDEKWNTFWCWKKKVKKALVVHYSANRRKPWKTKMRNDDIWWSYAIKTPFYDKIIQKNNMNKKEIEKKLKKFGLISSSWVERIKGWFR